MWQWGLESAGKVVSRPHDFLSLSCFSGITATVLYQVDIFAPLHWLSAQYDMYRTIRYLPDGFICMMCNSHTVENEVETAYCTLKSGVAEQTVKWFPGRCSSILWFLLCWILVPLLIPVVLRIAIFVQINWKHFK